MYQVGARPWAISAADFNGDGYLDIVNNNPQSNDVSVLQGKGNGTFSPAGAFNVTAGSQYVVASDVNGDGRPDLVVGSTSGNLVNVLLNNSQ
jgi:hypothetical protein